MIIDYLYAENASNYDKVEYNFSRGLTIIEGDNKSGKSSLMDIARFAIYGNCVKSKKIEFLKKRGSTEPMVTKIQFPYKSSKWEITRGYEKKGKSKGVSSASLVVGGELKAEGVENVNIYLKDNFVSEALLCNSNLVQQRDASGLLLATPTERANICKKVFDQEYLKVKSDMVKNDIKEEESKLDIIQSKLKETEESITTYQSLVDNFDLDLLYSEIDKREEEIKEINKEKDKHTEVKALIQKEIEQIDNNNKEVEEYNKTYNELKETITSKEQILSDKEQSILSLDESIKELKNDVDKLTESSTYTQKQVDNIKLERIKLFDEKQVLDLQKDMLQIEMDIKKSKDNIELIESGKCPRCGKEVDHLDKESEVITLTSLEQKKSELRSKIDTLQREKEEYDKVTEKNQKQKEDKLALENNIKVICTDIKGTQALIEERELSVTEGKNNIVSIIKDIDVLKEKSSSMKIKELENKEEKEGRLNKVKLEILAIENLIQEKNNIRDVLKEKVNEYNTNKKTLEDLKVLKKTTEKEITKVSKLINNLKEVRTIYEKKLPLFIMMNKLNFIAGKANSFLYKMFDKYIISFEQEKDSLLIVFTDNVTKLPSDYSNLSGFESGIGGLAVRLGFAEYNNLMSQDPINFLGLDEVDSDFTEENSEMLFNIILGLKNQFSQIIMISHKKGLKEMLDYDDIISVKNNGINSYIEGV